MDAGFGAVIFLEPLLLLLGIFNNKVVKNYAHTSIHGHANLSNACRLR